MLRNARINPADIEIMMKGKKEVLEVMGQYCSELEPGFLGFTDNYREARKFIPDKSYEILDIGCYLAVQSYLFTDCKRYIGVDRTMTFDKDPKPMKRCQPDNAVHYEMSGQEYIAEKGLSDKTFVIMSAVPDFELAEQVFKEADNCYIAYPGSRTGIKVNGKIVQNMKRYNRDYKE